MPVKKTVAPKKLIHKSVEGLKRKTTDVQVTGMGAIALAYFTADKKIKEISKEREVFKEKLVKYVQGFVNKKKPHDSYSTIVKHAGREVELRMTARSSTQPKPDVEKIIGKKFRKLKDQLIDTIEVLDMGALEQMLLEGKMTEDEVKELVDVVTNHAFTPKIVK